MKKNMLNFLSQFHQKKLFNIGLSFEKSIICLRYGKAIIWPIVGEGAKKLGTKFLGSLFLQFWGQTRYIEMGQCAWEFIPSLWAG